MRTRLTRTRLALRVFTALAILILTAFLCSLAGSETVSVNKAFEQLISGQEGIESQIYFGIRLSRIILAGIIGMALACSGVVLQGLLRNPLADPYILGISSGAGLGAVLASVFGFGVSTGLFSAMGTMAFLFALLTVGLVWGIARLTGQTRSTHLLLSGVVINAFFSAVIMFITSISRADQIYSTIFWLMGNIRPESGMLLAALSGIVVLSAAGLFVLSPALNVISFERKHAQTFGISVGQVQGIAFAIAALITAISVALSGLIGFAGLVVPHCVRLVFGPDHRQLIPLSALYGAVFLIAADTLARTLVAPAQLPVGVITALIGAPFFLILLIRYSRKISLLGK